MTFETACLYFWSTQDFVGKCCFCVVVFRESTGSTKKNILHKSFFHDLCLGKCWELIAIFSFTYNQNEY